MMPQKFELEDSEIESALWKKLRERIESRMITLRKQNDVQMSSEDTNVLRGKIAFAKELLGLDLTVNTADREASGS